jgi:hypothetical protein
MTPFLYTYDVVAESTLLWLVCVILREILL